jgi:hypothetical protein
VPEFVDYERYDALGLAELVRRKAVSPLDLLEAAIKRVETRNPVVNAVVMPLYDYGRKAIEDGLPEGTFRGVPFLLKDLGGWLAGVKVTRGSHAWLTLLRRCADGRGGQRARAAPQACWPRDLRSDEFVRARPLLDLRAGTLRPNQEPLGHDAHLRGIERRCGRSCGRAYAADGACFRWVRLNPRASVLLRDRGP